LSHTWTRFFILRLLGLVYCFAFLALILQFRPLLGQGGLTPVADFLVRAQASLGSSWEGFKVLPSLFWLNSSDAFMLGVAWAGLVLSIGLLLGAENQFLLLALWAIYLSFVKLGQVWYGYGWESQLLETGFLAVFLTPWKTWKPLSAQPPPLAAIWLLRWLIVRIMLGSSLIKLRGDPCWRDLSCLFYHFETQPLPNPLSPLFNALPHWLLRVGVLFNFAAELLAPCLVLLPWRRGRAWAGLCMAAFQFTLILSGNLSFLNWLTLVPILACFDDGHWRALLHRPAPSPLARGWFWNLEAWAVLILVAVLSRGPVANLLSPGQAMNTSFDPLDLVNTYGAFGSVGKERAQLVFEGTQDAVPGPGTAWQPYVFKCQPGPLDRRPCLCAPYQYRLDWQLWFAAMARPGDEPWVFPLVWKLLGNDPDTLGLFASTPFPGKPPTFVRALLYRYRFAEPWKPGGAWWNREALGEWLPPLNRSDPRLRAILGELGRQDLLSSSR
jgi:Lipase maturation factor